MSEKMRHCYVTRTSSALTDISTVRIHQHPLLREFRQIFLDRIIQFKFTRFIKLKHGGAGDFTGHRINAKQRVFRHRFLLFYIKPAQRFEINQLAIPGYCCHDPRNITVIDVLLKVCGDRVKPRRRKTCAFRVNSLQTLTSATYRKG